MNESQKHGEPREARHLRVHTIWFHLCEVLEHTKSIYCDRNQISGCLEWALRRGRRTGKRATGNFWGQQKCSVYRSGWWLCMYAFVKTHQTESFKCFHLAYIKCTSIKLIKNHKMRSKFSVLELVGFSNKGPSKSLYRGQHNQTYLFPFCSLI